MMTFTIWQRTYQFGRAGGYRRKAFVSSRFKTTKNSSTLSLAGARARARPICGATDLIVSEKIILLVNETRWLENLSCKRSAAEEKAHHRKSLSGLARPKTDRCSLCVTASRKKYSKEAWP